jgi:hypothetical protein
MPELPEGVKRWGVPLAGVAVGFAAASRLELTGKVASGIGRLTGGFLGDTGNGAASVAIFALVGWLIWSMGGTIAKFIGAIFFGFALAGIAAMMGVSL